VGLVSRWQRRKLISGGLCAEEVRDLPDHPARRLGRPFTLEERPDPAADLLLGAFDRPRSLLGLGSQLVHTS
jgi:hypothetical protein